MELLLAILLAIAAVAAVVYPLIRGDGAGVPLEAEHRTARAAADVEGEIRTYRTALRAGTLCRRCGRANPEGSRFCAECGRRLAGARGRRRRPAR